MAIIALQEQKKQHFPKENNRRKKRKKAGFFGENTKALPSGRTAGEGEVQVSAKSVTMLAFWKISAAEALLAASL